MFNPSDYDLDREYRQRQMARSSQVRKADEVQTSKSKFANPLLQANLISIFWIVVSVLLPTFPLPFPSHKSGDYSGNNKKQSLLENTQC